MSARETQSPYKIVARRHGVPSRDCLHFWCHHRATGHTVAVVAVAALGLLGRLSGPGSLVNKCVARSFSNC